MKLTCFVLALLSGAAGAALIELVPSTLRAPVEKLLWGAGAAPATTMPQRAEPPVPASNCTDDVGCHDCFTFKWCVALYPGGAKTPDERELFDSCMEVATSTERARLEKELRVYLEAERECKERKEKKQTGLKRFGVYLLLYGIGCLMYGIGCLITARGPKEEKVRLVISNGDLRSHGCALIIASLAFLLAGLGELIELSRDA